MPKAPPFTRDNAREMQAKSTAAQNAARALAKAALDELARQAAAPPRDHDEEARKRRAEKQIETCDRLMEVDGIDADTFVKLTAAKERLWRLVFPTAGVMRPRSPGRSKAAPSVEPAPQAPQTGSGQPPT